MSLIEEMVTIMMNGPARDAHIRQCGYVRPTPPLVSAVARYCPLVEVGAGPGELARQVAEAGGRVLATDDYSWNSEAQWGENWVGSRHRVVRADAVRAARLVGRRPGLNLLASWPSYEETWCAHAARLLSPGQHLLLIAEDDGGCVGDETLFELLREEFDPVEEVRYPAFAGLHDYLQIYRKRERR